MTDEDHAGEIERLSTELWEACLKATEAGLEVCLEVEDTPVRAGGCRERAVPCVRGAVTRRWNV